MLALLMWLVLVVALAAGASIFGELMFGDDYPSEPEGRDCEKLCSCGGLCRVDAGSESTRRGCEVPKSLPFHLRICCPDLRDDDLLAGSDDQFGRDRGSAGSRDDSL